MLHALQLTLDLFADLTGLAAPTRADRAGTKAANSPADAAHKPGANAMAHPSANTSLEPTRFTHPRANRHALLSSPALARSDQGARPCLVAYEFRRSKRKTIGFAVDANGLVVSAPRWVPLYEIDQSVKEKAAWILAKLMQAQERLQRAAQAKVHWQDGAVIPFLGERITVVLDPRYALPPPAPRCVIQAAPGDASTKKLLVGLPTDACPERICESVQTWLMQQAKHLFTQRLNHFAPLLGVQWTSLRLSKAKSRWGSAASDGAIALNWRLIEWSPSVIDYVVVHELAHLRVMNHSPLFWQTVASILPDYKQRKAQLQHAADTPTATPLMENTA